eukprot:TRINITY_DN7530_c1_g1_i1.p1 TRINITY_DN7530_c1_g1~~TRINITY_DN7530_c1_g1_i1.p1  ORF type:complete len:190 (+),score=37.77 TRINITY_DN7530_c1_g1_i1:47-571(+)
MTRNMKNVDPVPSSRAPYPAHDDLRWSHPAAYDYLKKSKLKREFEQFETRRMFEIETKTKEALEFTQQRLATKSQTAADRLEQGRSILKPMATSASAPALGRQKSVSRQKLEGVLRRQVQQSSMSDIDPLFLLRGAKSTILQHSRVSENDFEQLSLQIAREARATATRKFSMTM